MNWNEKRAKNYRRMGIHGSLVQWLYLLVRAVSKNLEISSLAHLFPRNMYPLQSLVVWSFIRFHTNPLSAVIFISFPVVGRLPWLSSRVNKNTGPPFNLRHHSNTTANTNGERYLLMSVSLALNTGPPTKGVPRVTVTWVSLRGKNKTWLMNAWEYLRWGTR